MSDPLADKLVRIMARLLRDERQAVVFAAQFDFDDLKLRPQLAPYDMWVTILCQLADSRRLRDCIRVAREQFKANMNLQLLDQLLAVVPARMDLPPDFGPWEYLGLFDRA